PAPASRTALALEAISPLPCVQPRPYSLHLAQQLAPIHPLWGPNALETVEQSVACRPCSSATARPSQRRLRCPRARVTQPSVTRQAEQPQQHRPAIRQGLRTGARGGAGSETPEARTSPPRPRAGWYPGSSAARPAV